MKHLMLYEDWCSAGQLTTEAYPINEDWISDAAHFIGDVTAAVADVTVPGSGAVIDFINMLSYFVEAHFSSDSIEQTKLIISGLIQAFAILDPINAIAVGLKTGLNKVFSFFATKTPAAAAAARGGTDTPQGNAADGNTPVESGRGESASETSPLAGDCHVSVTESSLRPTESQATGTGGRNGVVSRGSPVDVARP